MRDNLPVPKKLIFVAVLFVALWLGWGFAGTTLTEIIKGESGLAAAGQWGDSFGVLNAFVSTFGFIGFLAAFLVQGETLKLQQADSAAARREQHQQRFESSFFQLLDLLRDLRSQIEFSPSTDFRTLRRPEVTPEQRRGYDAVSMAANEVHFWVEFRGRHLSGPWTRQDLVAIYEDRVHNQSESGLGAYFRVIYTILRRISEDTILTNPEKESYGNLVRSQLTSAELSLMGLNALSSVSNNFAQYIDEFRLLKYLPFGALRTALEPLYTTAFLARD